MKVLKWLWPANRHTARSGKTSNVQSCRTPVLALRDFISRTLIGRKIDMKKFQLSASLATSLILATAIGANAAPAGIKVGVLSCDVSGGLDIIRSSHSLSCSYIGTGSQSNEHYMGHISSLGANLGYTKASKM